MFLETISDVINEENNSTKKDVNQIVSEDFLAKDDDLMIIENLKKEVDKIQNPAFISQTRQDNPNYLSIIYANQKFYEVFDIDEENLLGKSYDFLFNELDLDYSSEDYLEYIRLVKSVKSFHSCSIIINLESRQGAFSKSKFKINFNPEVALKQKADSIKHYVSFSFEKIPDNGEVKIEQKNSNQILVRNLERAICNERLLRQVSYLIISDLPIKEIAQKTAKILCEYLKVDRCLLHDYRDGRTNFVVEYNNKYVKSMTSKKEGEDNIALLTRYINFQNHFYSKFSGKKNKSTPLIFNDTINDGNFYKVIDICQKYSILSQIAVTTIFNDKINGGMYLHHSEKRQWSVDEIELVEMVADQFSIAIDRSISVEKVLVANHELLEKTLELKEALKEEKNMRKMQSEFVAMASHEFKTPLQIIDSTRELIARKLKSVQIKDESLEKYLNKVKISVVRMNGLIQSTLNLSKIEMAEGEIKLNKQDFNLKNLILDIIDKNSNLALDKKINVLTDIEILPELFNADQKLLDLSFTNLITNAIKYSHDNSEVKINAYIDNKNITIEVIDQGIGIPKEDIINIGKKFFRAKNTLSVAGTGIGIYLTKYFVELHNGTIIINSEINLGTAVKVILPYKF
jgi:signal transduction histidine kinase